MSFRRRIKRIAKLGISSALHYSGVLAGLRAHARRIRAAILMYHRVLPESDARFDYAPNGMVVTRDVFGAHMRFLSEHYQIATISQLLGLLTGGETPVRPLAAITFDDGWLDNYQHARPIMRRYRVPATVFVTTNYVDGGEWYWLERLKFVLAHAHTMLTTERIREPRRSRLADALAALDLSVLARGHSSDLGLILNRVAQHVKSMDEDGRSALMAQIDVVADLSELSGTRYFMDWDEIRTLADEGWVVAAHSCSHTDLTSIGAHELAAELSVCKNRLESELQRPVEHFAYPYGKNNDSVRAQLVRAGYKTSCSTIGGLVRPSTDPYLLNRINLNTAVSSTRGMFACRLLGL